MRDIVSEELSMNERETKTGGKKPKSQKAPLIILLILIPIAFLTYKGVIWIFDYGHSGVHWSYYCANNMRILYRAMLIYANDNNNQYPTAEKWCDMLIEYDPDNKEEIFKCKGAGKGRCNFAINSNAEPNSPNDVVLLFETKGGWNQFGGPEILTTENHKGKGCNILFNSGHVKFVLPEQLGELNWGNKK